MGNRSRDNVKDQHSFGCVQVQATVARAVASFRFGLGIKRRAEVISTSATVYDLQLWHLGSQLNLSSLLKKLFKFKSQLREYLGKQQGSASLKRKPNPSTLCWLPVANWDKSRWTA